MKKISQNVFQLKPLLAMLVVAQFASVAQAGERESLEQLRATTTSLINALVQEGVLSKDKADALLKKASQDAADLAATAPEKSIASNESEPTVAAKSVRVQLVPEFVKQQMREEIKQEVMTELNYKVGERLAMPSWLDSITWDGDMRFRYQADSFGEKNQNIAKYNADELRFTSIANTTEDRERWRIRARLGANAKINDWLTAGFRLTTGPQGVPLTANQTESMTTGKYELSLDRAFLDAKFNKWLTVSGGRFDNPFFYTDLVWDPDLQFDGFAAKFNPKVNDRLSVFGTLGAFPIQEVNNSDLNKAPDKWLYAAQGGIHWAAMNHTNIHLAAALYDYSNIQGEPNVVNNSTLYDQSVLAFRQKGNNTFDINQNNLGAGTPGTSKYGIASEFRELNLTGQVDLAHFSPVHVILTGDYVKNIGFDQAEILARTKNTYKDETDGYQVRLAVGMPTTFKKHDWQVWGAYKRLEADSVVDAFADSNFHLGGTDAKGWILGLSYGLDKNTWFTARWFSTEAISAGESLTNNRLPLSIDSLTVDLSTRF